MTSGCFEGADPLLVSMYGNWEIMLSHDFLMLWREPRCFMGARPQRGFLAIRRHSYQDTPVLVLGSLMSNPLPSSYLWSLWRHSEKTVKDKHVLIIGLFGHQFIILGFSFLVDVIQTSDSTPFFRANCNKTTAIFFRDLFLLSLPVPGKVLSLWNIKK